MVVVVELEAEGWWCHIVAGRRKSAAAGLQRRGHVIGDVEQLSTDLSSLSCSDVVSRATREFADCGLYAPPRCG